MKKFKKKLQILTFVLTAGLFFASTMLSAEAFITKAGTVNTAVTLRQNADATSSQVMELTSGQSVKVNNEITAKDGTTWYQILVNDTSIGYVPASSITIGETQTQTPSSGTTQTVTVVERVGTVTANSAIRVRAQASTSSDQVASMDPNDTFLVLEDVSGGDGYTWHKIEFDDNGKTVNGYVRSDLVSVKEVTHEEEVPAETTPSETVTPSEPSETEAPYTVKSEINAEGTEVWYLVNSTTGEAKEISSLLTPQTQTSGNTGVYKVIVVVLLVLVVVAAGAATFFYMRWQDAEAFIYELREKQVRAKKQPTGNSGRSVPEKQTAAKNIDAKPMTKSAPKTTVPTMPVSPTKAAAPKATAPTKPATAVPTSKPLPTEVKREVKPIAKPAAKEVAPTTTDIVSATKKELQQKQTVSAKSDKWKSKNFLTDDDDLEFDFLDMDDK